MQHQKSEKKKVVVTLCRVFPVTHSLAGKPTEFEGKLKEHKKIHTIRYNKNGVWDKRYKDIASGKNIFQCVNGRADRTTQNNGNLPGMRR